MKHSILLFFICLYIHSYLLPGESSTRKQIRRFVLAIGANQGNSNRIPLLYAVSDAQSFRRVINEMGGVAPEDSILLSDPSREKILQEMENLQERIVFAREQYEKVEVIFYYSGHSDQNFLMLKSERLSYKELKSNLELLQADVRIAILDSCASGAITRVKGGKKKPPFLFDRAYNMKGYAFITSSSADEAAQESDQLRASFFTHYLVSGLRGAADLSEDGRVTLTEAYQYAFQETLNRTQETQQGPQHPNYNINMAGTGDVVMTDIHKSSVKLVFTKKVFGRIFIHDSEGTLVVELNKPAGKSFEIGLSKGKYKIFILQEENYCSTEVELREGIPVEITPEMCNPQAKSPSRYRGEETNIPEIPRQREVPIKEIPFRFSIMDIPQKNQHVRLRFAFSLLSTFATELNGLNISTGISMIQKNGKGIQISSGLNKAETFKGFQIAAGFNLVAKSASGVQISAGVNSAGSLSGAQISGVFNHTCKFHGVQLASINHSSEVNGAQIGVVNIAGSVRGVQVGVVNISESSNSMALGLINIYRKGSLQGQLFFDETGYANVAIKHGNNRFYNFYVVGSNLSLHQGFAGLGYGVNLSKGSFADFAIDGIVKSIYKEYDFLHKSSLLASLRGMFSFHLLPRIDIIAGVSYNYFTPLDSGIKIAAPFHDFYLITHGDEKHWIGLFGGLQFRII